MTDFQHPAEQGAEGSDFLNGKASYPTYQYSVFLNGGRDEQLVVRAATFQDLLAGKNNVQKMLVSVNRQPTPPTAKNQAACAHTATRTQVVKKEGPNKGRTFAVCQDCDQFLGFV